jgi:hypothetical protein
MNIRTMIAAIIPLISFPYKTEELVKNICVAGLVADFQGHRLAGAYQIPAADPHLAEACGCRDPPRLRPGLLSVVEHRLKDVPLPFVEDDVLGAHNVPLWFGKGAPGELTTNPPDARAAHQGGQAAIKSLLSIIKFSSG